MKQNILGLECRFRCSIRAVKYRVEISGISINAHVARTAVMPASMPFASPPFISQAQLSFQVLPIALSPAIDPLHKT